MIVVVGRVWNARHAQTRLAVAAGFGFDPAQFATCHSVIARKGGRSSAQGV